MAGDAAPGPSEAGPRPRMLRTAVIIVLVGALVAGAVLYYLIVIAVPTNAPPRGLVILVTPSSGNTSTVFQFLANASDDRDPATAIRVRWDWQNDSTWDTDWTTVKTAQHQYGAPDNYTVVLQAMDTGGLVTSTTTRVRVSKVPLPPLRIGTVLSLSGSLAPFGVGEQKGVTMAVDEINADGGVLGRPIALYGLDDATSVSTAAAAASTLVNADHVAVIIGSTFSGGCSAILPIAAAAHVFEIAPSCTSPLFSDLTYTGGWFARTVPSDAIQGIVAANYAYTNRSWRNVSVIAVNNAYGNGLATTFVNDFVSLGGRVILKEIVPEAQTSYTSYLQTVFGAGTPDGIYVIAYPDTSVQLLRDWWANRASWPTRWMFSEGSYDQNVIDMLVSYGVNVTGFEGTAPAFDANIEPPAYAAWAARYQTLYGSAPPLFAANAYDAAYLAALAAEAAGNTTGTDVRSRIQSVAAPPGSVIGPNQWSLAMSEIAAGRDVNYEGASGSVNVGALGDVSGGMIVWGVNPSNQLVTIANYSEAQVTALAPPGSFAAATVPSVELQAAVWVRPPDQ